MATDIKCPFAEPIPAGRKTRIVPDSLRKELADLWAKRAEFVRKRRPPDENFGEYLGEANAIEIRINAIEVHVLRRPELARIAYHPDWKYSIETLDVINAELKGKPARRNTVLEEIVTAFGSKEPCPWPFKKKLPDNVEGFSVPVEVRKLLHLVHQRERAAAKLIGDYGNCNDGGMWFRRHTIADSLEYFVNDFVRAVYDKDDRYSVDYYADFTCTFTFR